MTESERSTLRSLAGRYAEIAADPVNAQREQRARRINGLQEDRPLVWLNEVPWHEMDLDGELTNVCTDPRAVQMETFFRRQLYRWKHFQADMVAEPFYRVEKQFDHSGIGLDAQEESRHTDDANNIYSHGYIDQLAALEEVERLELPVITARPDLDAENVAFAQEVLDGILPVKLTGGYFYSAPWDRIARLRGMEPMLMDLIADPELSHAIMSRFTQIITAEIDQRNDQGLFENELMDLHCTPAWSDELDELAARGEKGRTGCTWYRGMAQPFGSASPAAFQEYELDYILPLAARFGLTYYGCCEPLHDRIDRLMKIGNLRKIGVSPWADVERSAEIMGNRYVFARKPNPGAVAVTLDEDAIRADIRKALAACRANGTPCEFVLKDISTVSYRPQNLFRWTQIVEETIDEFY